MIKVLMFDLERTLIDAQRRPFVHVREALATIARLETAAGKPLRSCLVCDFTLATPPVTPARVAVLTKQFAASLGASGLRSFFEPLSKRLTLSTHAGASLPARAVFETAVRRLGVVATLDECLLVTGNAAHGRAARHALGMPALQFAAPESPESAAADFDDWSDAAALAAHAVAPDRAANLRAVVRAHLAAQGVEVDTVQGAPGAASIEVAGRVWCPISVPGCDDLDGVQVAVPVTTRIERGPRGRLIAAPVARPSDADLAEATGFVRSLAAHGQIAGRTGAHAPRQTHPTHRLQTDAQGVRRLVRSGYSAA